MCCLLVFDWHDRRFIMDEFDSLASFSNNEVIEGLFSFL